MRAVQRQQIVYISQGQGSKSRSAAPALNPSGDLQLARNGSRPENTLFDLEAQPSTPCDWDSCQLETVFAGEALQELRDPCEWRPIFF